MKQHKMMRPRNAERGSVIVIVACLLTMLFAFSALAVDMGFRYTKSRTLQAVADAAVTAGMPSMVSGDTTTAAARATAMARANGYTGTSQVVVDTGTTNQLSVTTKMSAPSFFSAIFGGGATRPMSSTAVGLVLNPVGPALLTLGSCGDYGLNWSGTGCFDVKGAVESSGPMTFSTGGGCINQKFENTVQSACGTPSMGTGLITYMDGPATGGGGPFTNPFSAITFLSLEPYCTHGHTYAAQDIQFTDWISQDPVLQVATLNPGVYCSSGDINLSGPQTAFIATGVTIIAGGAVTVGANNTIATQSTLSAAAGVPGGLAIFANLATTGCSGQAINLGSYTLKVTGSVYAPNGCARLSGQTGMEVDGSVVANDMAINAGTVGGWTFDPTGGSGSASWRMYK